MSKGLGRVERAILAAVSGGGHPTPSRTQATTTRRLASAAYGTDRPTVAQLNSVRRAVRSLRAKGLVQVRHRTAPVVVKTSRDEIAPDGTVRRVGALTLRARRHEVVEAVE
jgi:hypothetical protein